MNKLKCYFSVPPSLPPLSPALGFLSTSPFVSQRPAIQKLVTLVMHSTTGLVGSGWGGTIIKGEKTTQVRVLTRRGGRRVPRVDESFNVLPRDRRLNDVRFLLVRHVFPFDETIAAIGVAMSREFDVWFWLLLVAVLGRKERRKLYPLGD